MPSPHRPNPRSDATLPGDLPGRVSGSGNGTLSRRELEVAGLLGLDLSYHAMAKRLCVSRETVRRHVKHIFVKLGVRSRHAAVHRLHLLGWIAVPPASASGVAEDVRLKQAHENVPKRL